jgi:hypothetical protein
MICTRSATEAPHGSLPWHHKRGDRGWPDPEHILIQRITSKRHLYRLSSRLSAAGPRSSRIRQNFPGNREIIREFLQVSHSRSRLDPGNDSFIVAKLSKVTKSLARDFSLNTFQLSLANALSALSDDLKVDDHLADIDCANSRFTHSTKPKLRSIVVFCGLSGTIIDQPAFFFRFERSSSAVSRG